MNFEEVKYIKDNTRDDSTDNVGISCKIDGKISFVPLDPANSDYAEILRQVDAGELTIEEAE